MKKYIILIIIIILLPRCKENSIGKLEKEIETQISEDFIAKHSKFDLSKVTTFRWSKLYVFKVTATIETIEKTLNQSYPYNEDIAERLVFLDSNDKIVYHEDTFPNIEAISNKDVVFSIPDTAHYRVFISPIFSVSKINFDDGYYYLLNQ